MLRGQIGINCIHLSAKQALPIGLHVDQLEYPGQTPQGESLSQVKINSEPTVQQLTVQIAYPEPTNDGANL